MRHMPRAAPPMGRDARRYDGPVRWLVDGYNVIRRSADLSSAERQSLEAGRAALCRALAGVARATGDQFTVVFDGARGGGAGSGGPGVRVIFSSARETADSVLARLARDGGAVVSNDGEVRRAAVRAGAIAVSTDQFLARLDSPGGPRPDARGAPAGLEGAGLEGKDEAPDPPRRPRAGNPRRLGKKARAAARALSRLAPPSAR
jgi:predicted RNA-binding protein with PIN domain